MKMVSFIRLFLLQLGELLMKLKAEKEMIKKETPSLKSRRFMTLTLRKMKLMQF
jgi:hypothetical protein